MDSLSCKKKSEIWSLSSTGPFNSFNSYNGHHLCTPVSTLSNQQGVSISTKPQKKAPRSKDSAMHAAKDDPLTNQRQHKGQPTQVSTNRKHHSEIEVRSVHSCICSIDASATNAIDVIGE